MGKARKRTHGTVFARPNGTFTAQITDVGVRRSIGTFPTRGAAERALAASLVEGPPPSTGLTLGDYLDEWLADQTLTLKATTAARNRNVIQRYVVGHRIAKRKVRDLTPGEFRTLYRELSEHGKLDGSGLAAGTIATLNQVLKSALQRLVDDQELHRNPIPRRAVMIERRERPWLRPDQVRELIRFARFRAPDLEVVVRLGSLAGLRRGEICGLRWSDIDLATGTATIRRNRTVANGRVSETSPKTGSSMATVNLDPGTVETLERHRRRRADLIEQDVPLSEYVVCSPTGEGRDPNNVARSFRRLIDEYRRAEMAPELPDGLSLHSLRHSFASGMVSAGTNLRVAAEAMRHSGVRLMDRYAHLVPSMIAEAVHAVAAEVDA